MDDRVKGFLTELNGIMEKYDCFIELVSYKSTIFLEFRGNKEKGIKRETILFDDMITHYEIERKLNSHD